MRPGEDDVDRMCRVKELYDRAQNAADKAERKLRGQDPTSINGRIALAHAYATLSLALSKLAES